MGRTILRNDHSRVFIVPGRVAPNHAPIWRGYVTAGAISASQAEPTRITDPAAEYGKFEVVDMLPGEKENGTMSLTMKSAAGRSEMLHMLRNNIPFDLLIVRGRTGSAQDYEQGWLSVRHVKNPFATSFSEEDGANSEGDRGPSVETLELSVEDFIDFERVVFSKKGASDVDDVVTAVAITDTVDTNNPMLADATWFVALKATAAAPALLYSNDQGETFGRTSISTLATGEDADELLVVGDYLLVASKAAKSISYARIADILRGTETWLEVATGIDSTASVNGGVTINPAETWFYGDNGYIYKMARVPSGVVVKSAGLATTENLKDMAFFDSANLVAVGANNAVVYSANGGDSWTYVPGPAAGVALNTVAALGPETWIVGTANGKIFYTVDAGLTWVENGLPVAATAITKIRFSTAAGGWALATTAAGGRILRTISGGYSWYEAPETQIALPTNTALTELAVSTRDPEVIAVGGTVSAALGILIKGE